MSTPTAPQLFKLAALLNAISIPGHMLMGLQKVYPALTLLKDRKHAGALAGARNSWDNVNILLLISGTFLLLFLFRFFLLLEAVKRIRDAILMVSI
jgi:hypothetical protein